MFDPAVKILNFMVYALILVSTLTEPLVTLIRIKLFQVLVSKFCSEVSLARNKMCLPKLFSEKKLISKCI